jgi:hypothetical protein
MRSMCTERALSFGPMSGFTRELRPLGHPYAIEAIRQTSVKQPNTGYYGAPHAEDELPSRPVAVLHCCVAVGGMRDNSGLDTTQASCSRMPL